MLNTKYSNPPTAKLIIRIYDTDWTRSKNVTAMIIASITVNDHQIMKYHFWHLEISNIEFLNVKYNLNNNIVNTHNNTTRKEPKQIAAVGNSDRLTHNIELMRLTALTMMLKIQAMKYTILMDVFVRPPCKVNFLIDTTTMGKIITRHNNDGKDPMRKLPSLKQPVDMRVPCVQKNDPLAAALYTVAKQDKFVTLVNLRTGRFLRL